MAAMNPPHISIITVCFNKAEFIEQTIQSVLSQSYPFIEYIIIDGGSTDGSVEIIRRYASRLAYWHSRPDRNVVHAFNLGLAQVHGDWILYLNADDFFLEAAVVEKMVPHLIIHKDADVVFGETIIMECSRDCKPAPMRQIHGHPWSWQEFRRRDTIPHPSSFTHRRYFERVGGFDESYSIATDYELFLRGGKELRTQYVPLAVTGMREGGCSRKKLVVTLLEARRAIYETKALPFWLSWVNFFYLLTRTYLGLLAHKVLDPLAPQITWPGRNAGEILKAAKGQNPEEIS